MADCSRGYGWLQAVVDEVVIDAAQESDEKLCSISRSCDV